MLGVPAQRGRGVAILVLTGLITVQALATATGILTGQVFGGRSGLNFTVDPAQGLGILGVVAWLVAGALDGHRRERRGREWLPSDVSAMGGMVGLGDPHLESVGAVRVHEGRDAGLCRALSGAVVGDVALGNHHAMVVESIQHGGQNGHRISHVVIALQRDRPHHLLVLVRAHRMDRESRLERLTPRAVRMVRIQAPAAPLGQNNLKTLRVEC